MTTIGVLALLMFGLGPAGATLGVLAPMVGFGMFALGGNVFSRAGAVFRLPGPPPHRRIVVVSSGVDDPIARVVVGFEIRRMRSRSERELQDRHAWEPEALT